MDLTLTAEQQLLVESARGFLANACPISHVRAMETDARGFDADLWGQMARLGWLGMALPESAGGSGQSFLEVALLLEEMGRVLLPSPFLPTTVLAAPLLLALGSAEQQRRWLPQIVAGDAVATVALAEPGWRDEWDDVSTQAHGEGDFLRLEGTKVFVPFAPHAALMLVAVRAGSNRRGTHTVLVAVEAGTPQLELSRLSTLGGDHLYEAHFAGARIPAGAVLGAGDSTAPAIERLVRHAAVAALAYAVGAAERVLVLTVDYAKTRVQFGRPIGSFQAIAHRCVDMRSDIDALRYLVYQAAWTLARGDRGDLEVSAAKAYGTEALRRVLMHAHQVHGAIGFSTEHDLQLFTRRAKALELQWGSATAHRERVAKAMGL